MNILGQLCDNIIQNSILKKKKNNNSSIII